MTFRNHALKPCMVPFCATCNQPVSVAKVTEEVGSGALFIKVQCHGSEEVLVVTMGEQATMKYAADPIPPMAFRKRMPLQLELDLGE